ncbi:BTAD domain-containing putative transcriptional regulator [Oryzobacter sp. R7]|uniref:nSTAND1 domain-containing NTPase n=1 Tax=Oryzobacter faecalis TaxID=3388656 RepID=UPI00398CEE6C
MELPQRSAGAAPGACLLVRLYGGPSVLVDDTPLDLGPPRQQALFAVLALEANRVVAADRIIGALWGEDPPRTAAHAVQVYVSELRRTFLAETGRPLIVTRRPGYVLEVGDDEVDAEILRRALEHGRALERRGDLPGALAAFEEAVAAAAGGALVAVADDLPVRGAAAVLDLRRLDAQEALAAALVEAGALERAGDLARGVTAADPLRERAVAVSMLAAYRSGRQGEALRAFAALRRRLADELGADPSAELQRLHERMLVHDVSLLPPDDLGWRGRRARNPYKGLRPFGEEDAPDFHGREAVVLAVLDRLRGGVPLVALVGPSGSGKSSVLGAGLVPALRAATEGDLAGVRVLAPDRDVLQTGGLDDVLDELGTAAGERVVLVLDQFEEVFLGEDGAADDVLAELAGLLSRRERDVRVVLALRADYYDRPLRHPDFAPLFGEGVLTLLPMHPDELERAIAAPAARVGAAVEPALLAELVADSTAGPAVLPLLQFVLTELFDQRGGGLLTLAAYRAVGGLRGALTREAEALRNRVGPERERLLAQLVLRMVRVDDAGRVGRRVVPVGELTRLVDVDTVAVGDVLGRLNELRLVTYDRGSGEGGTVEMSHEALVSAWPWLQDLVTRHALALRRHAALVAAVAEWDAAGRDPEYLLAGSRLAELRRWADEGVLSLTTGERQFIDAGLARDCEAERRAQQEDEDRRALERRSRRRLVLLCVAAVVIALVAGLAVVLAGARTTRVALALNDDEGRVDALVQRGLDDAARLVDLSLVKQRIGDVNQGDLQTLAAEGPDLVVSVAVAADVTAVARRHRDTWFVAVERPGAGPNVTNLVFADQQTAFLAGAAAALTTRTGHVAFLGGADTVTLRRFEAGFVAGVGAVDPSVRVDVAYASRVPDYSGFVAPAVVAAPAELLLAEGVDVLYVPAGTAQVGGLQAVARAAAGGREVWAIGADEDMARDDEWQLADGDGTRVLTSTIKRFDIAVREAVRDFAQGRLESGSRVTDLAGGGLSLATTGEHLAAHRTRLAALEADVVAGRVVVPCVPEGLTGTVAEEVAAGPRCPAP